VTTTPSTPAAATPRHASLQPIIDAYVRIQRALHADTLAGVKSEARSIAAEAGKLGPRGAAIKAASDECEKAVDLKGGRAAFARLGDAIMIYAKESGATLGDELRVAYGPMVQKYWLQKGEQVQNPFYGKAMADCGRLNPTLPSLQQ